MPRSATVGAPLVRVGDFYGQDAPTILPNPATSVVAAGKASPDLATATVAAPTGTVNDGNLPAVVSSAMRQDMELFSPDARLASIARVLSLQTRADALEYMAEVQRKIRPVRPHAPGQ